MKRILFAATLAALSASAFAQTAPSGEWVGSVSLGASFAQNYADVRNTNLGLASEASRTTVQDKTAVYLTSVYGKTKAGNISNENANNLKAGGRYEWNFAPQTYAFAALDFETDRVVRLDLRTAVGIGAGYYFVKSDPVTFTAFAGVGYRNDRGHGVTDNSSELLLGEESIHKLSATTTFKQRLVLYPNVRRHAFHPTRGCVESESHAR
jgi:putative salt-induced outer membrane protein